MIGRKMKSLIVLSILVIVVIVTGSEFSDSRDDEVDRLLKKLNKPAFKSIKSPDGDMRNHPIYDNPLFKNHTIQMRPSSFPDGWNNSKTEKKNIVFQ
ncbi:Protein neprosin [Cardamine amara subsp. amara]|uniref:Protein neprosin n=1 Tax=Cardamine amara subsp. amara TaxID=228776 RepID=A0ABD1BMD9_CARAN